MNNRSDMHRRSFLKQSAAGLAVLAAPAIIPCRLFGDGDTEEEKAPPIKVLFVTGGGFHDYVTQEPLITQGLSARIGVEWTVDHEAGKRADFEPTRFRDENWIKPFDLVIYSKGISRIAVDQQKDLTERIAAAHREFGIPAIFIHNALHFGREVDLWHDLTGVVTRRHGRSQKSAVRNVNKDHVIMKGFPESWTPEIVEPYIIQDVRPGVVPLAEVHDADRNEWYTCYWTHQYGRARVFGTTIGHANATVADPVFLDTLARGALWCVRK